MSAELKCNVGTNGLPVIKPLERFRSGYPLCRPRHPTTIESDLRVASLRQFPLYVAFGMDEDSENFQKFKKLLSQSAKDSFSKSKPAMLQPLKNWRRYKEAFTKALENSWIISEDAIPWLNGFGARSVAGRRRTISGTKKLNSLRDMTSVSTSSESRPVPALLHAQTTSDVQRRLRTRHRSQTFPSQAAVIELEVPPRPTPEALRDQQDHEDESTVVLKFLQSLNPPMDHLQRILLGLGINTELRLKVLSEWPKHRLVRWVDEWADEYGYRVEPFELEVVAEAFKSYGNANV